MPVKGPFPAGCGSGTWTTFHSSQGPFVWGLAKDQGDSCCQAVTPEQAGLREPPPAFRRALEGLVEQGWISCPSHQSCTFLINHTLCSLVHLVWKSTRKTVNSLGPGICSPVLSSLPLAPGVDHVLCWVHSFCWPKEQAWRTFCKFRSYFRLLWDAWGEQSHIGLGRALQSDLLGASLWSWLRREILGILWILLEQRLQVIL